MREVYRRQVVCLRKSGHSPRDVAKQLVITLTALHRAAKLQRQMDELGITDPYQPVTVPPADCTKLRRHLHPRYRFKPRDDSGQF